MFRCWCFVCHCADYDETIRCIRYPLPRIQTNHPSHSTLQTNRTAKGQVSHIHSHSTLQTNHTAKGQLSHQHGQRPNIIYRHSQRPPNTRPEAIYPSMQMLGEYEHVEALVIRQKTPSRDSHLKHLHMPSSAPSQSENTDTYPCRGWEFSSHCHPFYTRGVRGASLDLLCRYHDRSGHCHRRP